MEKKSEFVKGNKGNPNFGKGSWRLKSCFIKLVKKDWGWKVHQLLE